MRSDKSAWRGADSEATCAAATGRLRPATHGPEAAAGEAGPAVCGDFDVELNNEGVTFDV
jgi:hypothetical protein